MSRIVKYERTASVDMPKDTLTCIERVLERSDCVDQFVAKRYSTECVIWWEGPPGEEQRKVRNRVDKLLSIWRTEHGRDKDT